MLSEQTHRDTSLHIWNNNPAIGDALDAIVEEADTDLPMTVTHSSRNTGSIGRFYLARALANRHPYIVCIDDDQTFPSDTLATLADEAAPCTVSAYWAFHFTDGTERVDASCRRLANAGEAVKCVGPGGMVADSRLFQEDGFWSCPPKFWFCDDIWLSYFADSLGWMLRRSAASVSMDNDGLDQYHQLSRTKTQMLRHFVSLGWNVSLDAKV